MKILIVTGEPLGAYHISPLYNLFDNSDHYFAHLIPYPEKVQGTPCKNLVSDFSMIKDFDRLIVIGGGLSLWSEMVFNYAIDLGIEVLFSELAFGSKGRIDGKLKAVGYSSMNITGAEVIADAFNIDKRNILVTGSPHLSPLPKFIPVRDRVLLLSTANSIEFDRKGLLKSYGRHLQGNGYDVIVRPHPREDESYWSGFRVERSLRVIDAISASEYLVGYPGTAFIFGSSLGVKMIGLTPGGSSNLERLYDPIFSKFISSEVDFNFNLNKLESPNSSFLERFNPFREDSGEMLVKFWSS